MEKVQILFPKPQLAILRKIAVKQDRTMSELIRKAVDQWIDRTSIPGSVSADFTLPEFHCGAILIPAKHIRDAAYGGRLKASPS